MAKSKSDGKKDNPQGLENFLDRIAETVVLTDSSDADGLSVCRKLFDELADSGLIESQTRPGPGEKKRIQLANRIADALSEASRELASGNVDGEWYISVAGEAVSALNSLLVQGRELTEEDLVPFLQSALSRVSAPAASEPDSGEPKNKPAPETKPGARGKGAAHQKPGADGAISGPEAGKEIPGPGEAGLRPSEIDGTPGPGNPPELKEHAETVSPLEVTKSLGVDQEFLAEFILEASEHLSAVEENLLLLETDHENPEAIDAIFRGFHTIKGVAGFLNLNDISVFGHEAENLLDQIRKGKATLEPRTIDVIFESGDVLKKMVENLRADPGDSVSRGLESRIRATVDSIASVMSGERRGPVPAAPGAVRVEPSFEGAEPEPGLLPGEFPFDRGESEVIPAFDADARARTDRIIGLRDTVKVDAERLDRLVDTIGELVIAESMVIQSPELKFASTGKLGGYLGQLDKITRELQEIATSLRMVPVKPVFQKMARLVRDLSRKSGKEVDFVMTGEEIEIDKSVIDRLGDPLIHMIRNSMDHGIEEKRDRIDVGKPEKGLIHLTAYHKGGNIYIEIRDDGRGLDGDAIFRKAVERGLLRGDETLTDTEIFAYIFYPGFSTAKKITDVSGRGVGMDVVKRNIDSLRGRIEVQSTRGAGTNFIISLPLTLAIIDGMVISVGSERYIIPTLSIVNLVKPVATDLSTMVGKGEVLRFQDRLLPIFRLAGMFGVNDSRTDLTDAIVVVVDAEGHRAGLVADEVLGQQQIVIKSLGDSMKDIPGLSGGAIMPDGQVGLILDVGGLVRLVHHREELKTIDREEH